MIRVSHVIITMLGIALIFTACKQSDIIVQDKMSQVYVDILVIKEQYILNGDSLNIYQAKIFDKYGITKLAYEKTLKSYKYDEDVWKKFFKKVYSRIDTLKSEQEKLSIKSEKKNKSN